MQDFAFFDGLNDHFGHQFPFNHWEQYFGIPSKLLLERTTLYTAFLKKLIHLLNIPSAPDSADKELRPLFQLILKIDPHYFTKTSLSEELFKCYTITPTQQKKLLKHLVGFFNALGRSRLFKQQSTENPKAEWEAWYSIFPEEHRWEVLRMFQDLGEQTVASWQGYRAWLRYQQGSLFSPTDHSPLLWQELCEQWAFANNQKAVYPDLLAHAFAGELSHLGLVGYCGETPNCLHCPLKTECHWNNRSWKPASDAEEIPTLIQKEQFHNLSTPTLLAWMFGVEAMEAPSHFFSEPNALRELDQKSAFELGQTLPRLKYSGEKLKAFVELCKRYNEEKLVPGTPFRCSADIFQHFRFRLRDLKQECFILVLLDNQHQYLTETTVTKGLLNKSLVHPREVFSVAIEHRAAAIICVHNHPSGDPKASEDDIQVTHRLLEVGKIVGIPLLDHVIIGNDRYVSLADLRML